MSSRQLKPQSTSLVSKCGLSLLGASLFKQSPSSPVRELLGAESLPSVFPFLFVDIQPLSPALMFLFLYLHISGCHFLNKSVEQKNRPFIVPAPQNDQSQYFVKFEKRDVKHFASSASLGCPCSHFLPPPARLVAPNTDPTRHSLSPRGPASPITVTLPAPLGFVQSAFMKLPHVSGQSPRPPSLKAAQPLRASVGCRPLQRTSVS